MDQNDLKASLLGELGVRVRALRLNAGLSVKDFADRASLSPRFVHQLESGIGNISIAGLARVAIALGRSLVELTPPLADDRSPRAEIWKLLSDCDSEELGDLQQWLRRRKGRATSARFIALIGLRGAGKSTIGPLLAERLKTEFVEIDRWVEEAADMSLGEVFATHGEAYYRRLERDSIQRLFASSTGCVVATGGSVVSDAESWESIKRRCFTVWLHATPEEFMKRMRKQGDLRPMQGRPTAMEELKALLARREPLYSEATMKIHTTKKSLTAIVSQIIKMVAASR